MAANINEKLDLAKKALDSAKKVALFCHINPDGDTLGCGLAMFFALKMQNKEVRVFCDDPVPEKLLFMRGANLIEKSSASESGFDLAVSLDSSDIGRLGFGAKTFLKAKNTISIDHHKSHINFAKLEITETAASATAETVFKLLEKMGLLCAETAELLYAALVSDNGCFAFASTSAQTHRIAAKMLGYGFNHSDIVYKIWKKKSLPMFKLSSAVLANCRFFYDNKIAVITFTRADFKNTGTTESATEGVIVNVIDIDEVEVAFAVSEVGEYSYKVSIRTKDAVDAAECAAVFGGGGHKNAAGCRLHGSYESVIEQLVKAARDRLN
jgi:phosphoesterase RecJ-like protein